MSEPTVIEDGAGILWSQETDALSGRTVLTRITPLPKASSFGRPSRTVRVIEADPPPLPAGPPEESRMQMGYRYLLAVGPNSAAEATERLRAAYTQLTPGEIARAVDAYVKARL